MLLAPLPIPLHSTHDHIPVFVGNTDLGAVWRSFHVLDVGGFPAVDPPTVPVLHEDDNRSRGITGRQFPAFLVPGYQSDVAVVVRQVGRLVALRGVGLALKSVQFDQFEEFVADPDSEPTLVVVPGAGEGD